MRQGFAEHEIKQELSKFINLLQTDFKQTPVSTPPEPRSNDYSFPKKLSIIFSASQPQSSSLDKENSNPSANRSFSSSEKPSQNCNRQQIITSLLSSTLTPMQLRLVEKIRDYVQELKQQKQRALAQLEQVKGELSAEKKANDQMLGVLVKLDEQEKELWSNFNAVSQKYQEACEKNKTIQAEFEKVKESLIALQNDNDFMKKLIYHANENYEALEKKCNNLESHRERGEVTTDRKSIKKSSTDNLLKSAKTRKQGYSPSHSELMRSPSPQNFQQIYRKMIIRTLKFKGRSGYQPN